METLQNNCFHYNNINATDFITAKRGIPNGIIVGSDSTTVHVQQIPITSLSNRTLYTNSTNHVCYCSVDMSVTYDIVCAKFTSGIYVNDQFAVFNPLVNTVRLTGLFTLQPNEKLYWNTSHYKSEVDDTVSDNRDNPLSISGTVTVITFE